MSEPPADLLSLLDAVAFAARAHRHQLRKDGATPYVSHPFRVCLILQHVFGVTDHRVLTAAVLHDTIEDTTTDADDVVEQSGPDVRRWVAALTKDKRLPDAEREQAYAAALAAGGWQVHVCKLADVYDNLLDSHQFPPEKRARVFDRARFYLDALEPHLGAESRSAHATVRGLLQATIHESGASL
jgi:guanosine-3',5'-bis(diphosphate) 3'-pyrophosphohydrolase